MHYIYLPWMQQMIVVRDSFGPRCTLARSGRHLEPESLTAGLALEARPFDAAMRESRLVGLRARLWLCVWEQGVSLFDERSFGKPSPKSRCASKTNPGLLCPLLLNLFQRLL